jgi:dolichyl-phosphate-mannose-protein mannosyltransferase
MTKRRKSPHQAKRNPVSSSRDGWHRQASSRAWEWRMNTRWVTIVTIVISFVIAAIPFGYGRYFELNSPGAYDSGAYVYSAYRVLNGAQIGVDDIPSAKIGTLLVNMLGVSMFGYSDAGPKIIQGFLLAAALVLMFFSVRKIYGTLAGAVSITVAAIYLSSPAIAKFGNVKEQYMIAFMMMGISCFVLRQCNGRWVWALLAGALAAWAPLFKETGISAIVAIGLFVIVQPILKHRTLKQTGLDIGLLLAGAVLSMAPIFIWLDAADARISRPYAFAWRMMFPTKPAPVVTPATDPNRFADNDAAGNTGQHTNKDTDESKSTATPEKSGYISASRKLRGFTEQFPIIMRFYCLLILPIALGLGAILARMIRLLAGFRRRSGTDEEKQPAAKVPMVPDRFILLFAVWWLLDMAFVWISPRSYDQYYLPINASGAMLGAYIIGLFNYHYQNVRQKSLWLGLGTGAFVVMIIMVWPIFVGVSKSPHHGGGYLNAAGQPEKRRGYVQKLQDIADRKANRIGAWEIVARQIKGDPTDDYTIYVWGWYPGIYVAAGRTSSSRYAYESEMHTLSPAALNWRLNHVCYDLKARPPRYIIDSQKMHFPNYDHPVFDLWPRWFNKRQRMFDLRPTIWQGNPQLQYLTLPELFQYRKLLEQQVEQYCMAMLTSENRQDGALPDEQAKILARQERTRHEVMHQLREFVMTHYHPVSPVSSQYGMYIFERNAEE